MLLLCLIGGRGASETVGYGGSGVLILLTSVGLTAVPCLIYRGGYKFGGRVDRLKVVIIMT